MHSGEPDTIFLAPRRPRKGPRKLTRKWIRTVGTPPQPGHHLRQEPRHPLTRRGVQHRQHQVQRPTASSPWVGGRRSAVEPSAAPAPAAARAPRGTPRAHDPSATRSTRTARLGTLLGPFGHRPVPAHRRIADRVALAQRQSRVRGWPDANVPPPASTPYAGICS